MAGGFSGRLAPARAQSDIGFSPYLGALWFDGSCVNWDEGECEGHFTNGDPAILAGARLSMLIRESWGLELTYAGSPIEGDLPVVPVSQRNASHATSPDVGGVPFHVVAHLYYGALTYSLWRTERTNLFLSGTIGGITFNGDRDEATFTDLLLGLGIGGSVRLDRLISLRTDLRAFSQPCREGIFRDGFRCEDGSVLGHLELSGGVVLGFPGLPEPGSE